MPKSRHRKGQKKKSKARSEKVKLQKIAFGKAMQEKFESHMEELKKKQMEITEVGSDTVKK